MTKAKSESSVPTTINILGHEFSIKRQKQEDQGGCDIDKMEITLLSTQSPDQMEETLFHELIHASLNIGGVGFLFDEKTEEAIVRNLEKGLWPLVKFR